MPDQPLGLLLCDDLIFTSRISGTARDLGVSMKTARSIEALKTLVAQQTPQGIILDLANPGLVIEDLTAWLRQSCTPMPYLVAYGSHVDTATLKKAREAGCDVVLSRSKFVEDLPVKLRDWIR
jgi:CheY-like chemotaxis protein